MFENKKILVLGMARSGYEAAKYLIKHGNTVILNDGGSEEKQKKEQVEELINEKIESDKLISLVPSITSSFSIFKIAISFAVWFLNNFSFTLL